MPFLRDLGDLFRIWSLSVSISPVPLPFLKHLLFSFSLTMKRHNIHMHVIHVYTDREMETHREDTLTTVVGQGTTSAPPTPQEPGGPHSPTNPPVGSRVSMDRSVEAALPGTTLRLVRKSCADDSVRPRWRRVFRAGMARTA